MAADTVAPERHQPPTHLALNLSSNNPFRKRLSSHSNSPRSVDPTMQQFPFHANSPPTATVASKNPFLDPSEPVNKPQPVTSNTTAVDDIFREMSVSNEKDKPAFSNGPLPRRAGTQGPQHRPPPLDDRRDRPAPRGPPRPSESPMKRPTEHRRRASESSVMDERKDRHGRSERTGDRSDRPPRTESEERRRRERRREREERYRREKERIAAGGKPRKDRRHLDIIDKLDVTGVYGHGLFHHDGPFDACNPARNAKKDRRAPMQAFPEGSMNMALGGSGPNRSRVDLDKLYGRTEESFNDYSATRRADTTSRAQAPPERGEQMQYFHSTDRTEPVHGVESSGLGTSTFLEGAPASKSALQRRGSDENAVDSTLGGGLQRKKSLAQRLRGMSASQARPANLGKSIRSPESRWNGGPVELSDGPRAISAGGPAKAMYSKENEVNVFDHEYERRGTEIKFAEQEKPTLSYNRAPASPRGDGLTRSVTAEAAIASPTEEKPSVGGGLLNRMKSLKGGRRARPERKDSTS